MNAVYPARSVERAVFSEQFESYAKVHQNGGVLTGAPLVDAAGLHLDGTQYGTWAIGATDLAVPEIYFDCLFTPNFAWNDGSGHYLYDALAGNRYYALKSSGGNLFLSLGGTFIQIASAAYSAYWLVGQRNRFLLSSNGVLTNVWLNGTQILTNNATAWTVKYPTVLRIGASITASDFFDGIMHHVKARARLLTQLDVDCIQDDSLYTYPNRASVYLDMAEATERGGLKQTLDKSRYGRVCLLGDGFTAASIPDFKNPGFGFDGTSYTQVLGGGVYNNIEQSIVLSFMPEYNYDEAVYRHILSSTTTNNYYVQKLSTFESYALRIRLNGTQIEDIAAAVYGPHWRTKGKNVLVISAASGNTDAWLNGAQILSADNAVWSPGDPTEVKVGPIPAIGQHFSTYPFKLCPLQVIDATLALGVNA